MRSIPELPETFGTGIPYTINERLSVKKYFLDVYCVFYLSHEFLIQGEQKLRETIEKFIESYDMDELTKNSYEVRFFDYLPKSLPRLTGNNAVSVFVKTEHYIFSFCYTQDYLEYNRARFAFKDESSAYLPEILWDVYWSLTNENTCRNKP